MGAGHSPSAESILSLASLAESSSRPRPFSTATGGGPEPKSAASVGAVRTNAVGKFESSSVIRGDDSESDQFGSRAFTPIGRGSPSAGGGSADNGTKETTFPSITGYGMYPSFRLVNAPLGQAELTPVLLSDGSDPGIRSLIEAVYLDTFRDPLPELGPRISNRRPQPSRPVPSSASSRDPTLICHLHEHTGPILSILVSPDNAFFLSAAHDGLVKVWDTARLERNTTSKPRLVHKLGTKPTAMCALEGSHCFAVAGEDGSVVVLRVHVQSSTAGGGSGTRSSVKFREVEVVRYWQVEGKGEVVVGLSHVKSGTSHSPTPRLLATRDGTTTLTLLLHLLAGRTETTNDLLLLTSHSSLLVLSLHSMQITKRLHVPLHLGTPTVLCCDPRRLWVVVGTLGGYLTLWDMRFGILLRTWHVAGEPVRQAVVHPSKGGGRYVVVASGGGEAGGAGADGPVLETWSIDGVKVVEEYTVGGSSTAPAEQSPSFTETAAALVAQEDPAQAIANLLSASSSTQQTVPPPPKRRPQPSNRVLAIAASSSGVRGAAATRSQLGAETWNDPPAIEESTAKGGANGVLWVGGEDRFLRKIDLSNFAKSSVFGAVQGVAGEGVTFRCAAKFLCPPLPFLHIWSADFPFLSGLTATLSSRAHPPLTSHVETSSRPALETSTAHPDSIVALAVVTSPSSTYLVSGDRSGVLRIWRV